MARLTKRLTARGVLAAKPGMHADGDGLYLIVDAANNEAGGATKAGAKRWVFIFQWQGKRAEMGLGRLADVSLGEARDAVADARRSIREGINPIEARRAARGARGVPTFGAFAETVIGKRGENEKHRWQWRQTLSIDRDERGEFKDGGYCMALRDLAVDRIGTDDVLGVLQPIWQIKNETASRVRGRIEFVLDAAKAKGLRSGDNPARWRGHLDKLLPPRRKLAARGHMAAMPYAEVPAFVGTLRERDAIAARALEFLILTAARSGEVRGATWAEIDLKAKVWAVPANRMKAGAEHRVPLPDRALAILELVRPLTGGAGLIFPGGKRGQPLSDMVWKSLMTRMGVDGVTAHGFRSAFRDWAGDTTTFPREVAEAALAHQVGNAVELAYRRGDALAKRRKLMTAWARFVGGESNVAKFPERQVVAEVR